MEPQKVSTILQSFDKSLERRQRMASTLTTAFQESPEDMRELLSVVGKIYQKGTVQRFWDVLAILSGADRGYGNGWFYTALELERQYAKE